MAITRSSAAQRGSARQHVQAAGAGRGLEFWLMLAASAAVLCGILLATGARTAVVLRGDAALPAGPVNLNAVKASSELLPVLRFLLDPEDRNFAAHEIFTRLGAGSLHSVGELRQIRVTADQVRRNRGLSVFAARLQDARKQATRGAAVSIPLLTPAEMRLLRPLVVVRTESQFRRALAVYGMVFFVPFYLVHFLWRRGGFAGDRILLPIALLLSGIGFILMARLRDPFREDLLFPDFAIGVALGCLALLACSLPDYERTTLRRLAYVPLAVSFLLSVILLVFGSGPGVSDAKVNLRLGPISVQPVEFVKVLLVLFLAGYFANRWEFFRELRERSGIVPSLFRGFNVPRLRYALPVAAAVALAILFFFLQKDLGPALVLLVLFLALYAVARGRAMAAVVGTAMLVAAFGVGYHLNFPRTVASRVNIWLSPWDNFARGGDHLAQSLWTLSSGGMFGSGLGMGEPESVPAVHTDFVLAAVGEELGFIGLALIGTLYLMLLWRWLRISLSASGFYTFFLGLGFTLLISLQVLLISGGVLGVFPLSGVVTPYLNYGKTSAIVNFALLGVMLSISARPVRGESNAPFRKPVAAVMGVLGGVAVLIVMQAARVQVFSAQRTMVSGALIMQADGYRRYTYNPRLMEVSEVIPRGSIFDRNGIPLATSSGAELERHRGEFERLGIDTAALAGTNAARKYPFGALTFHVLGDFPTRLNWAAPNTSFVERDVNVTLQGYDDRSTIVNVSEVPHGPVHPVVRRDLRELIPLVRYRYLPGQKQVQQILSRDRDVHLTLDIRLQKAAAEIVQRHLRDAGRDKGAAIVIDPATGDLLATVTYPYAGAAEAVHILAVSDPDADLSGFRESLLDRARYGLYPPGSSFKLVTASAALQVRENVQNETFECKRLPDGRIGNYVRGWGRPIRDDVMDKTPHGTVNMARGIILSCNAYFAQLGVYVVGAERLLAMADNYGIHVASPNTAAHLRDALAQAAYGQGQVVATPLQMARVAAAMGNAGVAVPVRWVQAEETPSGQKVVPPEHAQLLSQYMRSVVTEGTGRSAGTAAVPLAGKTGTAELRDRPSHAWFIGFAPYGGAAGKKVAFAVIVENGQYGGRVAAPLAAEIVSAAQRLGIMDRE